MTVELLHCNPLKNEGRGKLKEAAARLLVIHGILGILQGTQLTHIFCMKEDCFHYTSELFDLCITIVTHTWTTRGLLTAAEGNVKW